MLFLCFHSPQAGEIVVLDWGHGKIFLGLVLKSGEVMSTKTSLLKSKKDIAEGVMPKGLGFPFAYTMPYIKFIFNLFFH